jgi:glycosyltransferase involved in cell wall biosynthesis
MSSDLEGRDIVVPRNEVALPVSGLVLTHNEEANLDGCLSALTSYCAEIHVVDSGSSDRTLEIARRYTDQVEHHIYTGHGAQLAWALSNLPFRHDWVLMVDADNVVTPALGEELYRLFAAPEPDVNGYYVRYRQHFRGRPMRGLKSLNLALFKRSHTSVDVGELVDHRLVVRGRLGRLRGELLHKNAKEDDIDFWIDKHQGYATRVAVEEVLRRYGRIERASRARLWGTPDERMILLKDRWFGLPLYVRPLLYFLYRYFLRLGFLDGTNGLVYHIFHALWFRLLIDVRVSDLEHALRRGDLTLDQLSAEYLQPAPGAHGGHTDDPQVPSATVGSAES